MCRCGKRLIWNRFVSVCQQHKSLSSFSLEKKNIFAVDLIQFKSYVKRNYITLAIMWMCVTWVWNRWRNLHCICVLGILLSMYVWCVCVCVCVSFLLNFFLFLFLSFLSFFHLFSSSSCTASMLLAGDWCCSCDLIFDNLRIF